MQAYTSPRRFLGDKRLVFWCLGVVVAAVIILLGFFYNRHDIRIHADGKVTEMIMRSGTVAEAIKKAGIPLGVKDIVEPPLQTALDEDLSIRVIRLVPITLIADGNTSEHWVTLGTVEQTLKKLNVALNQSDQVSPATGKMITSEDTIEVIRFSEQIITQSIKIPYKTEQKDDNSMERGSVRVIKKGEDGLKQQTVKITLKNGKEIKREMVEEKILHAPVNKVVLVGTMRTKVVSRGDSLRFSKVLSMHSTAYTHTGHRTATGIYPYKGIVAVDPKVIPLGTKLYIDGYGYATAADIGSSVKGNRIDVFVETEKEARSWGRRTAKVYILQ